MSNWKPPETVTAILMFVTIIVSFGIAYWTIWDGSMGKLMPVLVIATKDVPIEPESKTSTQSADKTELTKSPVKAEPDVPLFETRLFIRNIGFGPALNSKTVFEGGTISGLSVEHRKAVATNEGEDVKIVSSGKKTQSVKEVLMVLKEHGVTPAIPATLCISYTSADGHEYVTRQIVGVTPDGADLTIDYADSGWTLTHGSCK